ncbi:MAG TPA: hypothetical protein VLJ79_09235 [Candidatus Binatia bacterium]|nr:hypothetical protein [Candidatus Binatia bacterium]
MVFKKTVGCRFVLGGSFLAEVHRLESIGFKVNPRRGKTKNETKAKRYRTVSESPKTKRRIPAVASFLSGKVGGHAKVQDKIISRAQKETGRGLMRKTEWHGRS